MRREDGSKYDVRRGQSLKGHPPELTKKVTLMEHFKNYLDETHPNRDSPLHHPTALAGGHDETAGGVYVRKWMRTRHSIIFRLSNNNFQVRLVCFVCVWLSLFTDDTNTFACARRDRERETHAYTQHTHMAQVNFFDDTEVLLWAAKPWVTYKGKNKQRNTYNVADITHIQELSKRLKYTKDILSQLITAPA